MRRISCPSLHSLTHTLTLKIENFHQILQILQSFTFKRHVFALICSALTFICVFNRVVFDCRENFAFSSVILTRIQAVFAPKFLNFHQILQIFTFKCHVSQLIFFPLTFICVFNRSVIGCGENSAFSSVVLTGNQTVSSSKILHLLEILQIIAFKCHVFPLICSALTFICVFN